MNTKAVITFVLVTLGVLAGSVALLWRFGSTSQNEVVSDVAGEMRLTKGSGQVILVEFSDFQCPACRSVQKPLAEILSKYDGKVKFVYRYFPLSTIHKNALISAQVAEAANKQGKFWLMHDKLFETQSEWENEKDPRDKFVQYAKDLGLDVDRLKTDMDSQEVKDAVTTDNLAATRYRLTGTPTFFVNGVQTEFGAIESKLVELTK